MLKEFAASAAPSVQLATRIIAADFICLIFYYEYFL